MDFAKLVSSLIVASFNTCNHSPASNKRKSESVRREQKIVGDINTEMLNVRRNTHVSTITTAAFTAISSGRYYWRYFSFRSRPARTNSRSRSTSGDLQHRRNKKNPSCILRESCSTSFCQPRSFLKLYSHRLGQLSIVFR